MELLLLPKSWLRSKHPPHPYSDGASRDKPRQKEQAPSAPSTPEGRLSPGSREEALDEAQVPHGLHDEVAAFQQPVGLVGPLRRRRLAALLPPGATGLLGTAQHSTRTSASLSAAEQFPICHPDF